MPVSLLLFLGLENMWLCDSIKSITLVPIIIWDTNIPKDIFCYSNTKVYTSHVIWKMIHIRCGLKLFKNLIIRNLSGRAMSELFELWPACFHTKWAKIWKHFGKPHNGAWIFFLQKACEKYSRNIALG